MQQNSILGILGKPPIVYGNPVANQLAGSNSIIRPNDNILYASIMANSGPSQYGSFLKGPSGTGTGQQTPQGGASPIDEIVYARRALCLAFPILCLGSGGIPYAETQGDTIGEKVTNVLRDSIIGLLAIVLIGLAIYSLVK